MIHRHLDVPADAEPEELGLAALDDLLDRGDLEDWKPVARAVAREPFGPLAARVLALCDANPRQGTSRLWRAWIDRRRARSGEAGDPVDLAELRARVGRTQAELAHDIGSRQSDVSKLERRGDVRLATLRKYLGGLGFELELRAIDRKSGRVFRLLRSLDRPPG